MTDELLTVVVRKREQHAAGVVALELVDPQGQPLPAFEAGAHIDLHLGDNLIRQYSLCNDPADNSAYRVGVLKDPNSRGGSIAVHERLLEGTELQISAPRNLFPLAATDGRSILVGGGIGVTPMIAMAYALHAAGKPFDLWYCGRSRSSCAFVDDLLNSVFADRVHLHFDDEHDGAGVDLDRVFDDADDSSHMYTCGPAGFMEWVMASATSKGFADERIHKEFFQVEVETGGSSFEVYAEASDITVTVGENQSIAQALTEAGLKVRVSCEQGTCGTCLCDVIEGIPDHRDVFLTDEEKEDNDQMLLCCSRAKSPRLVLDI
ncbi:PDR/VanB family oxidoreductase [Oceanobacter sp. 4_MG-2023]|uniref:PDR/VanB family oxidoreductase n=1 Tax=Oceanobacter sp. 4_MG-2023 TaxID=3062623 RepID=UPI002735ACF3|nr:PDR/VanB family oxidoreductase [Oceanobacter sp. 4_MG-2023]MDP2546611.1 PDR/VanB family oxidoreductase [Oceanobacter sp. 4_MG-2023]